MSFPFNQNQNFMNQPYSNYNNNNYMQQAQQQAPATNKIYVTSLEDALGRFASPNSIMQYTLQDESMLFEIYTDIQGRKNVKSKNLADSITVETVKDKNLEYVSRKEFEVLKAEIKALKENKGENVNVE